MGAEDSTQRYGGSVRKIINTVGPGLIKAYGKPPKVKKYIITGFGVRTILQEDELQSFFPNLSFDYIKRFVGKSLQGYKIERYDKDKSI